MPIQLCEFSHPQPLSLFAHTGKGEPYQLQLQFPPWLPPLLEDEELEDELDELELLEELELLDELELLPEQVPLKQSSL